MGVNVLRFAESNPSFDVFVKRIGRTFVTEEGLCCYDCASGVEFRFYGRELRATLFAGACAEQTPAVCVLLDGEKDPRRGNVTLRKGVRVAEYLLAEGLEEKVHHVRILKTTEPSTTSLAFFAIETDGYFAEKPADRPYRLEIYGDSITAGALNMRKEVSEPPTPEGMQNSCYTYAWLAAENLNAELRVHARTGVGLCHSYGAPCTMKDFWSKSYLSEFDYLHEEYYNPEWAFSDGYQPDLLMINIGTNDKWQENYDGERFTEELTRMVRGLLEKYAKSIPVLLLSGVMGVHIEKEGARACEILKGEGVDISYETLPLSSPGHPREADHFVVGEALTEILSKKLEK